MKLLLTIFSLLLIYSCISKSQAKSNQKTPIEKSISIDSLNINKYISYNESLMAFINATVIDGTGNDIKINQTVIIEDGIFKLVGESNKVSIPAGATVLDLNGKTIIPGIVGLHNHLHVPGYPYIGDVASKLYFASGLTTIQTCGAASPFREIELSKQIENQEKIGPDIITSAPYITGPGGSSAMIIPRDEQHIRDTLKFWIDKGVKWFKVYRHTRPRDLKVIVKQAHKYNAKVTGHFCSITFEEAIGMGVDGIEHGLNSAADFRTNKVFGECSGGRSYMDDLEISSDEVLQLHRLMIDNGVFLNSTLSIYESGIPERAFADDRTLKAMSPALIRQYKERIKGYKESVSVINKVARLKRIMAFEYQFFQMGGLLGAGVDPGRHNLPGYGDQRNYELFIEAGFTTEEAIEIMTGNGAKILGKENIGAIANGKRADFVILEGDLKRDSSVIRNVEFVFKKGVGYNPDLIIEETNGQLGIN